MKRDLYSERGVKGEKFEFRREFYECEDAMPLN
jgi:hypothetical protein